MGQPLVRATALLPAGSFAVVVMIVAASVALAAGGCGRSPLYDLAPSPPATDAADVPLPLPLPLPLPSLPDAQASADRCVPQPETCNGIDDDCDGEIDEDQAPIPCPGGGSRYCAGGRFSECPRRCDVCIPGGHRTCFVSFCTYWGHQDCAADGRSFGPCAEARVPSECAAIAQDQKRSAALEQCCIDSGYCCVDEFDLDHDGDRTEMVGRCADLLCTP